MPAPLSGSLRIGGTVGTIAERLQNPAGWLAILWIVVFWRLGYVSLLDPDEAHYAELTREMLQAREWLVPLLDGQPHLDKPVLYHWLQAIVVSLVGESELALRLPGAFAALALFTIVRWAASRLFDARIGNRAAMMFATVPMTFALASVAVFDMVYTTFLFGTVAILLVSAVRAQPRLQYAGWALLPLAVMTKGPIAWLLIATYALMLWLSGATRIVARPIGWKTGLLLAALVASPWFVSMAVTYRELFLRDYVLAGNLWYFTRPLEFSSRNSDSLFYARTFLGAFFPWSVIALGRGIDTILGLRRGLPLPREERALWLWTLLILGFFTAARFKLDTYIFAAAPSTCMLAAIAWTEAAGDPSPRTRWTRYAVIASGAVMIVGGVILAATIFQIDLGLTWVAGLLPAALIVGGSALAWQTGRHARVPVSVVIPISTLLAIYAVVVSIGFPVLERSRPTAPIGRWIATHAPADLPVGAYRVEDWRASIRYYTKRRVVTLSNPADVREFVATWPDAYILMINSDYRQLRRLIPGIGMMGGRPAIIGRTGKDVRRQIWGRLVIVGRKGSQELAFDDSNRDLPATGLP